MLTRLQSRSSAVCGSSSGARREQTIGTSGDAVVTHLTVNSEVEGFKPRTLCGKVGSCLLLVRSSVNSTEP